MKSKGIKQVLASLICALAFTVAASAQNAGKDVFTSKCTICHGADGSGNTSIGKNQKIRDLRSADVQKQSDADLKAIITKGKKKMPEFEDKLTADQIDHVITYVRELGKPK